MRRLATNVSVRPDDGADAVIERIAKSSDFISQLLLGAPISVELIGLDGSLEAMSAHARKTMEIYDFSSVRGLDWLGLWPVDERSRIADAIEAAKAGSSTRLVARRSTARGALCRLSVLIAPVRDDSGAITRLFSSSVEAPQSSGRERAFERAIEAERRRTALLAERLAAETRRSDEAQRSVSHSMRLRLLGGFVAGVVHDINNVLAVTQGAVAAMRRQTLEPRMAELAEEAERAVGRGGRLVRRLLDFARAEAGEVETFRPRDLIERDGDLMRRLAGPGVTITFDLGDDASADAWADAWAIVAEPAALQSALFNLIANARDAIDGKGSVHVAVRDSREAAPPQGLEPGDYVVVSVADDGQGMTPEVLARAGEPFFTTKGPGEGAGLGLASAFEFAQRCGGRAIAKSAPGAGTTVSLFLARAGGDGTAGRV